MAADLGAAQSDLSTSLIDLRGSPNADPALVSQSEQQLAVIMALKGQLSTASGKQLVAISAQVAAAVSTAASTARSAQQAAASGISSGSGSLGQASQAARAAVNEFEDAYFKQRKFDPYLEFKSAEEERAYRAREAERQKQIEAAQAMHTPEGDERALRLSIEQMKDAGAHGADRSPDFAPLTKKLEDRDAALKAQLGKERPKVAAIAQPTPDPLDSVQPASGVPSDLLAKFKAAGVVVADQSGVGHGVNVDSKSQQDHGPALKS